LPLFVHSKPMTASNPASFDHPCRMAEGILRHGLKEV
jgi:hypothetical protein